MSRRLPPFDAGAELSLVGAALLRQQVVDQLKGYVDPSDFYNARLGTVWDQMLQMYETGEPIDLVTVSSRVAGRDVPTELLIEAQNTCPAVSAGQRYADIVVEASRKRKLLGHLSDLAERCYTDSADEVLADIDPGGDHLIAGRSHGVRGLSRLDEFIANAQHIEDQGEWLAPHILRPRWRVVLVAGEGVGKATIMRFFGLHMAAGRDPWHPGKFIMPRRVLYVDAENPATTVLHQVKIANLDVDLATEAAENYFIWHREGGINLRDRRARAEFEIVLQQTRPEAVFAGPFYKLFRRKGSEDLEQSTVEFLEVLDDFRVRFNFALMLEAHAPKGNGGYREMNPRGSAALMGWPEFGITMEVVGNPLPDEEQMTVDIGRFRRDRERADWPAQIMRGQFGQRSAWIPRFPRGRNHQGFPY